MEGESGGLFWTPQIINNDEMDKSKELETFGSTWLGRLFDRKVKATKQKQIDNECMNICTCSYSYQVIGCAAYPSGKCIWHPDNDPYDLKNRHWVNGKFVKK